MANAVEHTASFLRVPNTHLLGVGKASSTFSSLRELGLSMMLSSVLSNPSFTYAAGGMQNLLLKHCKNKYFSLHATWKRLSQKGFLRRTRIPVGTNCFHDYYTLSDTCAFSACATEHLSQENGKSFLVSHTPYLPPHTDFTMVSREMLMDPRLSLAAKGLYALLVRQLRLAAQCQSENRPEISKRALRTLCSEGKNAFDGLFRELQRTGYLALLRTHEGGKLSYVYKLCDTSAQEEMSVTPTPNTHKTRQKATATDTKTEKAPSCAPSPLRLLGKEEKKHDARAQIEYDILRCDYAKSRLDLIVSIIEGATIIEKRDPGRIVSLGRESTTAKELGARLRGLDSEDIRFVLDTLANTEKTTSIHNLRRYMTACLYFAKENLALALDSFSFPGTVPIPIFQG